MMPERVEHLKIHVENLSRLLEDPDPSCSLWQKAVRGHADEVGEYGIKYAKLQGMGDGRTKTSFCYLFFHVCVEALEHNLGFFFCSNFKEIFEHTAYKAIIVLGKDNPGKTLPLIFQDYAKHNRLWSHALREITGVSPVKPEHKGRADKIREDWLEWGKQNGFLPREEEYE